MAAAAGEGGGNDRIYKRAQKCGSKNGCRNWLSERALEQVFSSEIFQNYFWAVLETTTDPVTNTTTCNHHLQPPFLTPRCNAARVSQR